MKRGFRRKRLFWQIYLLLLVSLVALTLVAGAFWALTGGDSPGRWRDRVGRIVEAVLPPATATDAEQQAATTRLADAMGATLELRAPDGRLIAQHGPPSDHKPYTVRLSDGRLATARVGDWDEGGGWGFLRVLIIVGFGVALLAWPVVRLIVRRLEGMRRGVERWGGGDLSVRLPADGRDELAVLAQSFNAAAARVEDLVRSNRSLLANASHELRSPLARLRLAVEMMDGDADDARRAEAVRSLAEVDDLVEEILLASRLDARATLDRHERIDLLALAAEVVARHDATLDGEPAEVAGDPRLLRRLLRNLLDNAARHGRPPVLVRLRVAAGGVELRISDGGPGVPPAERARLFEPFYRPPGASEAAGGWGLGLALVRQIAERHGGAVRIDDRPGGGSDFVVTLPLA